MQFNTSLHLYTSVGAVCVCVYVCIYTYVCTHTHTYIYIYTHTHTLVLCLCVCVCVHIHTQTQTWMHAYIYTFVVYICAQKHLFGGSPWGVVIYGLNNDIVINEFELPSRYCVRFQNRTLEKSMIPLIPSSYVFQ